MALPQLVVIKSVSDGNLYYKSDGSVFFGENNVFETTVKIEAEKSTIKDDYYNLRFVYSNKYLQKKADDETLVAVSNQPEEDTSKPSCTLFEAARVSDNGEYYLRHVQSGGVVRMNPTTMAAYVDLLNTTSYFYLVDFINSEDLVKFPTNSTVAFKGVKVNGEYLKGYGQNNLQYLQLGSSDPNDGLSGHRVVLFDDGTIGVRSLLWNQYWKLDSGSWILADSNTVGDGNETRFTPYKVDDNSVALRSLGNNMYCKVFTLNSVELCLNASDSSITGWSEMQVEELVSERKIYNVSYKMEDSRIFGVQPFIAGKTVLTNEGNEEATLSATFTYQVEMSYTFSNSLSLATGVSTSIEAGLPVIEGSSIVIPSEINTAMDWGKTITTSTTASATGTVSVPARSKVTLSYIGTQGSCSVPFDYTQRDKSSKDDSVTETDQRDGIYTCVNSYNFNFVAGEPQPL